MRSGDLSNAKRIQFIVNEYVISEIREIDPGFKQVHIKKFVKSFTGDISQFFNKRLLDAIKKAKKDGKLTKGTVKSYMEV